ncbi:M23 family metallopeptidase [Isoalcanivorax beigongshangi]|uniref:M23 family metallopeptidase n=1 Tax=Isoalcanivorax beigongshangi TaxID=3238810 RepID=A0ABV4AE06_9GAMM
MWTRIASTVLLCSVAALAGAADLLLAQQGEAAPGRLVRVQLVPGTQAWLDGTPLSVSANGWAAFGFDRDASGQRVLRLVGNGREQRVEFVLPAGDWPLQRVNGVPPRTVAPPPPAVQERIRAEAALMAKARAVHSQLEDFTTAFRWPLSGRISGVYGSQRIYNGTPGSPHLGLDIAAPTGSKVQAPAGGVVTLVHQDMFYNGGTLVIDHGEGVASTFIHLNAVHVEQGQRVEAGDWVADVGATGRASGPHLHWVVNWFDVRLDPLPLLPPR